VVDGLDVVAIGVEHVGAVVAFVVLGPRPGRTVVAPTRFQRRGVETVHGLPGGSGEGDVDPGDGPLACVDDKPPALSASEGQDALTLELEAETQRGQSCLVEPPAGQQVPRSQGDGGGAGRATVGGGRGARGRVQPARTRSKGLPGLELNKNRP
jgi:hypothetical protein